MGASSGTERFETLLRLLDSDRDRAGEKYEAVRKKLIKFFQWNSCFPAEDLADETFQRLEQRMGETEIDDAVGFAWGIAKNLRQEARKRAARSVHFSSLADCEDPLPDALDIEKDLAERMLEERRLRCLHLCLQRLPEQDRKLFMAYHDHEGTGQRLQDRQKLAQQSGLTLGALRVRINRLRDKLEDCARNCFASWQLRARSSR
jgi:RNA polymerase sigma factor (sigma-70 family)